MTMNKTWLLILAALCFHGPRLRAMESCDAREYGTFVAYAQSLNPLSEGLGRRMIQCSLRDYRESSLYWLSFYYHRTSQAEKVPGLAALLPAEDDSSPKAEAQNLALRGDNRALTEGVNDSRPGFIDDPWIIITLARTQMIQGKYSAAYANYTRLLRMKENQDAAEIELLFAYIWARDRDAAAGKLASLKRFESELYIRQALERAERLIGPDPKSQIHLRDLLSLAYVQERDNRGYAAIGGRAAYEGAVKLEIEALQHQHPLEQDKENVASLHLGKEWSEDGQLRLLTDIGYYSAEGQHLTGKLGAESPLGYELHGSLAVARREVSAYERAPARDRAGLMRDSVQWGFNWSDRLLVSGGVHREESDALFEDYQAEIRLGALLKSDGESGFGFLIPVAYRHRPQPSPDYRSFPHDFRIGLGLRLALSDGQRYRVHTLAVLESLDRDDYGKTNSFQKLLGLRFQGHARYYFQKDYYNFFEGSAYITEKMPGESEDERGSEFLLGIGVSQESH